MNIYTEKKREKQELMEQETLKGAHLRDDREAKKDRRKCRQGAKVDCCLMFLLLT